MVCFLQVNQSVVWFAIDLHMIWPLKTKTKIRVRSITKQLNVTYKVKTHKTVACLAKQCRQNVALIIDEMVNALTMTKTKQQPSAHVSIFLHPNFLKKSSLNDWFSSIETFVMEEREEQKGFWHVCV